MEELAPGAGTDPARIEREFFATARPSSIIQRFASTAAALRVDGGVLHAIA